MHKANGRVRSTERYLVEKINSSTSMDADTRIRRNPLFGHPAQTSMIVDYLAYSEFRPAPGSCGGSLGETSACR